MPRGGRGDPVGWLSRPETHPSPECRHHALRPEQLRNNPGPTPRNGPFSTDFADVSADDDDRVQHLVDEALTLRIPEREQIVEQGRNAAPEAEHGVEQPPTERDACADGLPVSLAQKPDANLLLADGLTG